MDELTPEQVAFLRSKVRDYAAQGVPLSTIDARLKEQHGVTSADVMKMSGQDFARSMGQGLTLGHLDELAGAVAKAQGKDYTAARDQVRNNDAEAKAANPKMSAAVEMLSGGIPAALSSVLLPGAGTSRVLNAAKGLALGTAGGAIASEGASTASSPGDIARDAFSWPTAVSGVLGAVGGGVVGRVAKTGIPKGAAGIVTKEAAGLLPNLTPPQIMDIAARQESLAPGTVVAADLSPGMQKLAGIVGADLRTSIAAKADAAARYRTLVNAKAELGKGYDALKGVTAPVDSDLLTAIAATGRKGVLPNRGAETVDLSTIHKLRSDIIGQVRETNNPSRQYDLRQQAGALTDWLQKAAPEVKGLDSDYAFLSQRTSAAKKTLDILSKTGDSYGVGRAAGVSPGSPGGSLPGVPLPGGVAGTVVRTLQKVIGPADRSAAAQAIKDQFLTPTRTSQALQDVLRVHGVLSSPADHSLLNAASSGVFGGVAPLGATNLLAGQQQ